MELKRKRGENREKNNETKGNGGKSEHSHLEGEELVRSQNYFWRDNVRVFQKLAKDISISTQRFKRICRLKAGYFRYCVQTTDII